MTDALLAVIALELAYLCLGSGWERGIVARRSPIGRLMYRLDRWRDR